MFLRGSPIVCMSIPVCTLICVCPGEYPSDTDAVV